MHTHAHTQMRVNTYLWWCLYCEWHYKDYYWNGLLLISASRLILIWCWQNWKVVLICATLTNTHRPLIVIAKWVNWFETNHCVVYKVSIISTHTCQHYSVRVSPIFLLFRKKSRPKSKSDTNFGVIYVAVWCK